MIRRGRAYGSDAWFVMGPALPFVVLLFCLVLLPGRPVAAADADPATAAQPVDALLEAFPAGMTADQLDAVLAVMDDEALRAALRERLLAELADRRADTAPAGENVLAFYARRLDAVAAAYPDIPEALTEAFQRPRGGGPPIDPVRLAASLGLLLACGAGMMLLTRWALSGRRLAAVRAGTGGYGRAAALGLRLALEAIEIAAFLAGILIAYVLLGPTRPGAPAVLFVVLRAAVVVLVAERLVRFLCDPDHPALRLIPVSDRAARAMHRVVTILAVLTAGLAAVSQILVILGVRPDVILALLLAPSIAPFAYLVLLLWRRRAAVTEWLSQGLTVDVREAPLLGAWPMLATVYLIGLWLVVVDAALHARTGAGTRAMASLLLLLAVPLAGWLVHRLIARFYSQGDGADETAAGDGAPAAAGEHGAIPPGAPPLTAASAASHVRRLMRAVWLVLVILALVVTARLWGLDPARDFGIGAFVVGLLFDIGMILLIGYIGWVLIVHSIDRALAGARKEGDSTRAHRMATLLPLFRKFLQVVLVAIVLMIVLSSLGIEIGPLLAGAGVIGLAVGLGAQSTIADILAGVFFLLEDSFHVGDYVEVGSLRGTVEGISLRSLKLRHHRGAVHTLPFGQIQSLTNYTRDWALVRLEFRVPPDTDLALVKRLVKDIGRELSADPEMGAGFIEPLKSQGVRRVEENALIIGIKYITKPGHQFVIRREAYQRIVSAFNENGIAMVGRGVIVRVEGGDTASHAVGAAAAEGLEPEAGKGTAPEPGRA